MPKQTFENHRVFPLHYTINDILMIGAGALAVAGLITGSWRLAAVGVAVQAVASVSLVAMTRFYALKMQDRIIRLEMQVRLARVLPDDLQERIPELTIRQLIGLRFASDAELPDLLRKVLDEGIAKAGAIKRLVKDWQPDHQRV